MPKLVDHDEQRRAIAEAAIAMIDAHGLEGVRLRDVAEAADVTTGAVTHYFDGKDAVIEAAMGELVRDILGWQDEAPSLGNAADVNDFAAAFLPLDAERLRQWRVWIAFWGRAMTDERFRALHRGYYETITTRLTAQLRAADRQGRTLSAREARLMADAILAAIDGVGTRAALEAEDWPPRRQRETLARLLTPLLTAD